MKCNHLRNDMERRQFIGTLPFVVGGVLVTGPSLSHAQTTTPQPVVWTNVKAFGATGDGVTDDTAAIQAAINSLEQDNDYRGGVLYFPAGRYRCTSTLVFTAYAAGFVHNIIARGDGPQSTFLDFSSAGAGVSGLAFGSGAQFGIEDMLINGAPGHGIVVGNGNTVGGSSYCSLFTIRNVRIQNCQGNGFMFINAYMGTLSDCWSASNSGIGFLFAGYHTSLNVSRCYASSNQGIGWSLNGMTYSTFTACGADSNVWGYAMTNMVGVAFTGCGAESNQAEGWLLKTGSSTVAGLPPQVTDIHGVTFTSCASYFNSKKGTNASGSHLAALTGDNRPIQFKMSGNASFCNSGSNVSMVLNGAGGPITVYDELSYFDGGWVTTGSVTRKTL